jgi:hypothetical protein
MQILSNATLPYPRNALGEKGFDLGATHMVTPWTDDKALMDPKAPPTALERTMEHGYAKRDTAALVLIKDKDLGVAVRPAANIAAKRKSA